MKRKTFYHISLSLPYLALLISVAITSAMGFQFFEDTPPLFILTGIIVFFSFSAVIWGPIYTWMVVVMLFWGRSKSADEVRTMYLLSPVLLACAMGIPALLVNGPYSGTFLLSGFLHTINLDYIIPLIFQNYEVEQAFSISLAWAIMAIVCVIFGYAFVGIVLLIEKVMKRRNLFKEKEDGNRILRA
jgi:hypothetical protein